MTKLRFTALAAILMAASGCSGIINAVKDAAFNQMKADAEKNGGVAIRFKGGQAIVLEITDPSSPAKGAKVEIPADAIPATITDAGLSMWGQKDFNMAATTDTGAGPAIIVNLVIFTGTLADNKLLTQATMTVPYGDKVSDTNHWKLAIAQELENNNGKWTHLDGLVDTKATKLISGKTQIFGLFLPVLKGDVPLVPVANTGDIKIMDVTTGEIKCQTKIDFSAALTTILTSKYQILNTDSTLKYDLLNYEGTGDASNKVFFTFKLDGTTDEPVPTGTLDLSSRGTFTDLTITCKGTAYHASNAAAPIAATQTLVKLYTMTEFLVQPSDPACTVPGYTTNHMMDGMIQMTVDAAITATPNVHAIVSLDSGVHAAGNKMAWCMN